MGLSRRRFPYGAFITTLMQNIGAETGITVLIASHDPSAAEAADWVYELRDGKLMNVYRTVEKEQAPAP